MATKELVLELSELQRVGILCPKCSAEIVFDLSSTAEVPSHCGACPAKWESELYVALKDLKTAFTTLVELSKGEQGKVEPGRFRVQVHVTVPHQP